MQSHREPAVLKVEPLAEGLAFPESPRWREGLLWFSDMHGRAIMSVDLAGRMQTHFELETQPSGLGWRPDGTLLVVSMEDRRLLEARGGNLVAFADLSDLAPFHCNDMIVDGHGRAYIGNFGFDYEGRAPRCPTVLISVEPDGETRRAAAGLWFPNGMVITPDGRTLIVAESMANRLTAFSIGARGELTEQRLWAELGSATADGICLDAEGAVWVASPPTSEVVRVTSDGSITHRVPVLDQAIACMLGGPNRRTLFVLSAPLRRAEKNRALLRGRIGTVLVDVAGAGLP